MVIGTLQKGLVGALTLAGILLLGLAMTVHIAGGTTTSPFPENASGSGINGAVFLGPFCTPLPKRGCGLNYKPLRARVRIHADGNSGLRRTVTSHRDGRFLVVVPAGHYTVTPLRNRRGRPVRKHYSVSVPQNDYAPAIIDYDNGFR